MKLVEAGPLPNCIDHGHELVATEEHDGRESFVCVECGSVWIQEALF
jgi:putative hemolysin